jgi:RHS repeat-associated protein
MMAPSMFAVYTIQEFYDHQMIGLMGSYGKVSEVQAWIGGSLWSSELMTYTNQGNIASRTLPNGVHISYQYDSQYSTFPVSIVEQSAGKNKQTLFEGYDTITGLPNKKTEDNNLITETEYDGVGREILKKTYDGNTLIRKQSAEYHVSTQEQDFHSVKVCSWYNESVKSNFDKSVCSTEYYNGFGLSVKKVTQGLNELNSPVDTVQIKVYNSMGNLEKISNPYYSSDFAGKFTTFTYDSRGRLTSQYFSDATLKSYGYHDANLVAGAVTVQSSTDGRGVLKRVYYNIDNNPVHVIEDVDGADQTAIHYNYNSRGLLQSIDTPQGPVNISYFQGTNLQKSISDPTTGTTSYSYYISSSDIGAPQFGKLKNETRPEPNSGLTDMTILYQYGSFGDPVKQTYSDGSITNFTYGNDNNAYNNNRLIGADYFSDGYTHKKNISYDAMGNPVSIITNLSHGAKSLCLNSTDLPCEAVYTNEFDNLGRLGATHYPDGKISHTAYHAGLAAVAQIEHNGKVYASYSKFNALTQAGQVQYGNGVATNYEYNQNNGRLNRMMTVSSSSQNLLDYTYNFDSAGNITAISDGVVPEASYTKFVYDHLNRLRQAKRMNQNFTYNFDSMGNLVQKEGTSLTFLAGKTLLKSAANNNAVTDFTYSASGNLISRKDTRGITAYAYNQQHMLKKTTDAANNVTLNFYDETGSRFLKIFKPAEKQEEIRTYYLGNLFEKREKWHVEKSSETEENSHNTSSDNKNLRDGSDNSQNEPNQQNHQNSHDDKQHDYLEAWQTTKYIQSPDGQKIASITSPVSKMETTFLTYEQYRALAQNVNLDSIQDAFHKISMNFMAYSSFAFTYYKSNLLNTNLGILPFLFVITLVISLLYFLIAYGDNFRKKIAMVGIFSLVLAQSCNSGFLNSSRNSGESSNVQTHDDITEEGAYDILEDGLPAGTFYYQNNHIGSASLISNAAGQEVIRMNYLPYGQIDPGLSGKYSQVQKKLISADNHNITNAYLGIRFTGQEYDAEQDLYYYGARFYDPNLGVFTTPDTIVPGAGGLLNTHQEIGDIFQSHYDSIMEKIPHIVAASFNRYLYTIGNPLRYTDPTGHDWGWFNWVAAVVAVVAIVVVIIAPVTAPYLAPVAMSALSCAFTSVCNLQIGVGTGAGGTNVNTSTTGPNGQTYSGSVPLNPVNTTPPQQGGTTVVDPPVSIPQLTNGSRLPLYGNSSAVGDLYGITQGYSGPTNHMGIDIGTNGLGPNGNGQVPVGAVSGGVVTYAGPAGNYGNLVIIDHGNGLTTRYAHNSSINVQVGQTVNMGQQISTSGSTGLSTAPHVHFEVRMNAVAIDPMSVNWR